MIFVSLFNLTYTHQFGLRDPEVTMKKVAVVYWTSTGNTLAMANAIVEGAQNADAAVTLLEASEFGPEQIGEYDTIAFGCPAMGNEELEESEFEPMFASVEGLLSGKPVALFGSYAWNDGQWMRDWVDRVQADGASLINEEGLTAYSEPSEDDLAACRELVANLA